MHIDRKRKLDAVKAIRDATPKGSRIFVDLALVVVSLFGDQQPVGVQLTWVRSGCDSPEGLAKSLKLSDHQHDSTAVGPVHEVTHLALYLGRDCSVAVRVLPPVVEKTTWDLIVQVLSPADCAVLRGPLHRDWSRRLVLRGVERHCEFIVGRCEFGCERLAPQKEETTT